MALLWQKHLGGDLYQVRSHGASVRLYSNGVLHSQWNPRDPLKGSLWELMLLPVFFLPSQQIRSILMLGVGGGALIRLLQRFFDPTEIIGVDIDKTHLHIARRYFGVSGIQLVHDDAVRFVNCLSRTQRRFDLVIDDLFGHGKGEPERSVAADLSWCKQLLGLTEVHGLLVANFGSRRQLLASGWREKPLRDQLKGSWSAELPGYENSVIAVSRQPLSIHHLKQRAPAALNPGNPTRRLTGLLRRLR
ncbi:spermidine synthase [Microbulbifer sp. TYP-18]|uniref:spermidine synthase n=1 Tax=Microbulbifer sp. TYP-18 TaxID=3230024 RepID=UPI0034C666E7